MFTTTKLLGCLEHVDPKLRECAEAMYHKTIDFGAHPNVGTLALATTVSRTSKKTQVKVAYLTADGPIIEATMKSAAQVGVVSLDILRHALPDEFDRLGVSQKLESLRQGL